MPRRLILGGTETFKSQQLKDRDVQVSLAAPLKQSTPVFPEKRGTIDGGLGCFRTSRIEMIHTEED